MRLPASRLSCRGPGLAGADTKGLFQISDEDLSVTDPARAGYVGDRFDDRLGDAVFDSDLDPDPWPEPRFLNLGDGHALYPKLRDHLAEIVQLERPYYGRDHLHEAHIAENAPLSDVAEYPPVRLNLKRIGTRGQ